MLLYNLQVLPQAKKLCVGGIDLKPEKKLDRIYSGVVATSQYAWVFSKVGAQASCEPKKQESNDDFLDEFFHHVDDDVAYCTQSKHPLGLEQIL